MACKLVYNNIKFANAQEVADYMNSGSPSFAVLASRGTFEDGLNFLEAQLDTEFERRLLSAIRNNINHYGIQHHSISIVDDMPNENMAEVLPIWQGLAFQLNLRINSDWVDHFDKEVFLHELVHSATVLKIHFEGASPEVRELTRILSATKDNIVEKVAMGTASDSEKFFLVHTNSLENEHEILAWGLSDPKFQEVLNGIKLEPNRSLWDTFVSFLLDLLGLKPSDKNALSALITASTELLKYSHPLESIDSTTPIKALHQTIYRTEDLKRDSENLKRDDETSVYTDASTKQKYDAVTGKVIPLFQHRQFDPNYDAGVADADRLWKNTPKDVLQNTWISGDKPISYADHVLAVNENRSRFIARAELYHLKFHSYFSRDSMARNQMADIMNKFGIADSEIDWLSDTTNGITAIQSILERRTGTDFWQPNGVDKIVTELAIKSDILGWAGRVDLSIDHGNDILSFFDIKTGYGINREFQKYFLNYGDTMGRAVWDNALNRAKLQLMLYAVIAKSERPELKFRNLKVLHIPSENDKHYDSIHNVVDVPAFLEIVQNFLQDKFKDKYDKLVEKSPNIFNPEHYNAVTYSSIGDKMRADADPAMELRLRILELQALVMYDKNLIDKVVQGKKGSSDRAKQIRDLMEQIIALKGDKNISYAAWDTDMAWMDNWLGSASYSTNPYVQLYHKILGEQKQKARDKYETWRAQFNKLLTDGLKELGLTSVTNYFGGPNREVLFNKLLVVTQNGETSVTELVTKDSAKWNELTETQKKLAQFMTDSIGYFFDDELTDYVDPRTGKKVALANQVVTYIKSKNGDKPVTNLGLHNRELKRIGMNSKVDKFKYKPGFFPKHAPTIQDIAKQHGGYLNRETLKYLWNKNTSNYFEIVYDQWGNTTEAIPMKFLGNPMIDYSRNFTENVELAVDSFVKQHFYKQHLDPVYTFGLGMKLYLGAKQSAEENTSFKKTIGWFEDSVNLHILGRKDITDDWVTRKFKKSTVEGWQQFNFTKFLRSLRNFFSGPTMWLKPVTGIANAVFASLVTLKEAMKNSFFIHGPHSNFGIGDLASGFSTALGMQFDAAQGKLRENKAFLLMEKFGYLPDNYDWYTRPNELLTARNKFFTSKTMMAFHAVPEETIATAMFVAQLKSMGVWDHYNVVDAELSDGTTYKSIEWDGTIRGKRNISNVDNEPLYEDVTGLIPEEIAAIKFLYEKIHGGYRLDERTRAEYYVMGELIMQFKKYMPGVMKNVLASRGIRNTQGFLKEETDDQGNKVLKWTPQAVEGRWRLLIGLMANYLNLKRQVNPQGELGSKLSEALKAQPNQSYDWSKLSDVQKEDVIDSILTFGMWMLLLVGYNFAWDRDDQDSLKKIYARIMNDVNLQVNPIEVINNAINFGRPVTINKFGKLLNSSVETFWSAALWAEGDNDAAFTEQGNLRGMKEFQRNLHFLSAYHDVTTFLKGSPDVQEALDIRLK